MNFESYIEWLFAIVLTFGALALAGLMLLGFKEWLKEMRK